MSYARELPDAALVLRQVSPETQATLRRAVSTAYYALFHFLIEEACGNWCRSEQHPMLARAFDHRRMVETSNSRVTRHRNASVDSAEFRLYSVAYAFSQLQQRRHQADYDLSGVLASSTVDLALKLAADSFTHWNSIRDEQIAQDYLFSLLFRER